MKVIHDTAPAEIPLDNSQKATILVVEDEPDIADLIQIHLSELGYNVELCANGSEGYRLASENDYAMVLLDIRLPGMDGFEICRKLRQDNQLLPIVMLTAKAEELDKVLGLELGADEYITKPFSIRELVARIKALFRRIETERSESKPALDRDLSIGDLNISPSRRKVSVNDNQLELTAKEFELLFLFASHPGRAFSRQELLDLVWGYQYAGYSHTVNSHINRLRRKIEKDPSEPRYIKTVWGLGYQFAELDDLAA